MLTLVLSKRFQKQLKKHTTYNPAIKQQIIKSMAFLRQNMQHPSLRTHKLAGQNNWSISVNKSIRIIAHLEDSKVYLLSIGTHEEVY